MTLNPLIAWIAQKQNRDPANYANVKIEASPGRAWSEITVEDFDCLVSFEYQGEKGHYDLDEREVCEFLESLNPNVTR